MAEYIDRKKYMKNKYNCDLIQIGNAELVPLYQIINKLEESIERAKIDKAISKICKINPVNEDGWKTCDDLKLEVLEILKRNIGE